MKIPTCRRQHQGGMATLVMLAILSLMCLYIAANLSALNRLEREIDQVEQHQKRRIMVTTLSQRLTVTNIPARPISPSGIP